MGERDARIGGDGVAGADARNDFKRDAGKGSVFTLMKNTSVDAPWAIRSQSSFAPLSFSGSSCPVITASEEDSFRWVIGMPAYAGTASALVTPGTTSNASCLA